MVSQPRRQRRRAVALPEKRSSGPDQAVMETSLPRLQDQAFAHNIVRNAYTRERATLFMRTIVALSVCLCLSVALNIMIVAAPAVSVHLDGRRTASRDHRAPRVPAGSMSKSPTGRHRL